MTSETRHRALLALLFMCAAAGLVTAQVEVPAPAPGSPEALPEEIEPERPIGEAGESLSEELERTRGVITPPKGIDPGVVEPTPNPQLFPTPVIPPGAVTPETQPR